MNEFETLVLENLKDVKDKQDRVLREFTDMDIRVHSVEQFRDNASRLFWIFVTGVLSVGGITALIATIRVLVGMA